MKFLKKIKFSAGVAILAFSTTANAATATSLGTGHHGNADGNNPSFNLPTSVYVVYDYILIADTFNNTIRKTVTNFEAVSQFQRDYVQTTSTLAGTVQEFSQYGMPKGGFLNGTYDEALFDRPVDIISTQFGILVLDSRNHSLRLIAEDYVSTWAGTGEAGYENGYRTEAQFYRPMAMTKDSQGNIFIADTGNNVIRRIDTLGYVTTVAGIPTEYGYNNGVANEALFNSPMGIAVSSNGVIFVSDTANHLIRYIDNGNVYTLSGNFVLPSEIEFYVTYYDYEWDEEPLGGYESGSEAWFSLPRGLVYNNNVLFVADHANHVIRSIEIETGYVSTIVGIGGTPGYTGEEYQVLLHFPSGIHLHNNNLYIADTGNNVIRTIEIGES